MFYPMFREREGLPRPHGKAGAERLGNTTNAGVLAQAGHKSGKGGGYVHISLPLVCVCVFVFCLL